MENYTFPDGAGDKRDWDSKPTVHLNHGTRPGPYVHLVPGRVGDRSTLVCV